MDNINEVLDRLNIIYDKALHLGEDLYYVKDKTYSSVINSGGESIREFYNDTEKFEKCGCGWAHYSKDKLSGRVECNLYIIKNNELEEQCVGKRIISCEHIADELAIIKFYGEYTHSIFGRDFERLTPSIYLGAKLNRESLHYTEVNVTTTKDYGHNYNIIRIDNDTQDVSHLFDTDIGQQKKYRAMAIEIMSSPRAEVLYGDSSNVYRYAVGKNGERITEETFTSITCSNNCIDRGLLEVWEEDLLDTFKGLIDTDGNTIIPPNRYKNIEETPFRDIFIVTKRSYGIPGKDGVGIYHRKFGESIETGTFVENYTTKFNIIAFKNEDGNEMYLGNDGNVYLDINKAFNVHQLDSDENVYAINVYGVWHYVDRELNKLTDKLSSIASESVWNKVNKTVVH